MLRKTSVVFFAMMFAIVALFAATESMATGGGYGYHTKPCEEIITPGVVEQDEHGNWIYEFIIDKESKYWHLNQLEFAFDSSLGVTGLEPVDVTLQDEGEGGEYPKRFGQDFPGRRVVIIDTDSIPGDGQILLQVTGAFGNFGKVGAHTRTKWRYWYKKDDTCQVMGPIPGSIAQQTPDDEPECVALDTKVSLLVRRGTDACAKGVVEAFASPNCGGDATPVGPGLRAPDLLYSGPPGQQRQCPQESVDVLSVNSPFYHYFYSSGGNVYELCIDLGNGTLVTPAGNCTGE